ncbi:MAG: ATP-binding protein, partial [Syntrophorhabdales bacterium]
APDGFLKDDFLAVAQGGHADREQARVTRSGKRIHIHSKWTVPPGYEKTVGRILFCDVDVTESRQAEAALRESEEKFRLLFEKSPDATFLFDGNTCIDCNEAALKLMPWLPKDQLTEWGPLDFSPERQPDGRLSSEKAREHFETLAKEGAVAFEWLVRAPEGREFWHDVSQTMVPIQGKKMIYSVCRDITKRKRAEEENPRLQAQLLQAQKMEAIGTLAGGVAHDFNNILTVIKGFAALTQMGMATDDPLRSYVDQITISSNKAADLTQSLLAFSRKQNITLAPRDINSLVEGAAKLLERLLREDITLKLELTDKKVIAEADVTQMDQVLMNLATNARDAMPHGGSLTIRTDVANLDETFQKTHGFGKPGTYVRLSVSDTGVGMDEKTLSRVFEPFFTTKEVGKGTGLGLASVYGIVKQHDGYITVTSKPHKWTTFDIYLPVVEMGELAVVASPETKGGSETILVTEDDADVRALVTKVLSSQGYTVLEAADGDSAMRAFKKQRRAIALVIIDVVLPGRNGKEVFDEISRMKPGIRAVFMSGYTGDAVIDKGITEESVDLLQKPLSVLALISKVREVLDR